MTTVFSKFDESIILHIHGINASKRKLIFWYILPNVRVKNIIYGELT